MSELRFRGEKVAKQFDAFKKVKKEYTETTVVGGTLSILSRILIVFLIYQEVTYYKESNLVFFFKPDVQLDERIQLSIDITVAMPCVGLSAVDLIDDTSEELFSHGTLKRESTYWELDYEEKLHFEKIGHINTFLREEYHSIAHIIFKNFLDTDQRSTQEKIKSKSPKLKLSKPFDACRLYGNFHINKVAGVLHFVSGTQTFFSGLDLPFRLLNDFPLTPSNFSHRINKFSFGSFDQRLIQPLEGDERILTDETISAQYFIKIVPTQIHNVFSKINLYQYSVTENFRTIDPRKASNGMPGIYFKYDWSALKVIVKADRDNLIQFLIRLCSIICGIVVISGIINSLIQFICRKLIQTTPKSSFSVLSSQLAPQTSMKTNISLLHNVEYSNTNTIILVSNNTIKKSNIEVL